MKNSANDRAGRNTFTRWHRTRRVVVSVAALGIVAVVGIGAAKASYDFPASGSKTGVRVERLWIDRDLTNNSDSEARFFIRFDDTVCGTPSGGTLAGLDIREGNFHVSKMMLNLALSAQLSGRTLNVRTNDGNTTVGCHLVRLTLDE